MVSKKVVVKALADVLDFTVGNRGSRYGNPYLVPEVIAALKVLADIKGIDEYLYVELEEF